MSILEELISEASTNVPAASLLRKVKTIVTRASASTLAAWVDNELNGYSDGAALPDYRGPFTFESEGIFIHHHGGQMPARPIASLSLPEEYRTSDLFRVSFADPIAALEDWASAEDDLQIRWSANKIGLLNGLISTGKVALYGDYGLVRAWTMVPRSQIVGTVDTVKTRVLELALTIEAADPTIGQQGSPTLAPAVTLNIHNTIFGDNANIPIAGNEIVQSLGVREGDRDSLAQALLSIGVDDRDIPELFDALESDSATESDGIGPSTSKWFTRILLKAEELGTGIAAGLIMNALTRYGAG